MKIYFTKYSLTKGVISQECDERDWKIEGNTLYKFHPTLYNTYKGRKIRIILQRWYRPDWHLDKGEAYAQARFMREKVLEAIRRRIDRLNKLNFDI